MNPRYAVHASKLPAPTSGTSPLFFFATTAALALCGFITNAIGFVGPSSPVIAFMYGSIAVLVAASALGPLSAVTVAIITALPTLQAWGHGWALLIFALEGFVCAILLRLDANGKSKFDFSVTLSAICFWVLIGGPLGYFAYAEALQVPPSSVKLIVTKLALNGIFNAALAEFLIFLVLAPNFGGWLRRYGLRISRWRIRDMYVTSIVAVTMCMVLVSVVVGSKQALTERYTLQRQHQENTLQMLVSLLPSQPTWAMSPTIKRSLENALNEASPRYALLISRDGERQIFGVLPDNIATDGPAFEASELDSRQAQHMSDWLNGYMIVRQTQVDGATTLVLVSSMEDLIDELWQSTADALITSATYVSIAVVFALVFSRYVTQSLTTLADNATLMRNDAPSDNTQSLAFARSQGFEPKEAHDLRSAIQAALEEEDRLNRAALNAAGDYEKIIEVANAPIVVINMTGAIIGWNAAARRITGQSRESVVGKKTEEVLVDQIPRVSTDRIIARLRKGGNLEGLRLSFKNTDGRRITLLLSGVMLNDASGEPDRLIMVGQNLTDFLEQEQQLLQASKMSTLGEMATGVAHELNQPLNAMRLSLANIERAVSLKPDAIDDIQEKLRRVDAQIDRATKIIDHLRLYGRRSDTGADHGAATFDPNKVVEAASSLFQEQFRLSNINFQRRFIGDPVLVRGDGMLLEQVLLNLLSNSRDAIRTKEPDGSAEEITIVSTQRKNSIELVVEDSGPGVDPHQVAHLFEPFFTTKPPGQGTGLGLSLAYSTVTNMGGSISATNGDTGLRVTISLPTVSAGTEHGSA